MKKGTQTERFNSSALLFRFCLAVLQFRRKDSKAHDQEIGNILQYNASDTSHWKRGKKAVKSFYALEALSRTLNIDFDTLHDICDGALDFDEAWYEFLEAESLRSMLASLNSNIHTEYQSRKTQIAAIANDILIQASINSVPTHIPELAAVFPYVQLVQGDVSDRLARSSRIKTGSYSIRFRKGEMRAHTRVAIAREIARIVLHSERERYGLPTRSEELAQAEVVDLSNHLLVPTELLRKEFQKIPNRRNAIRELADAFWVPKSVVRARLTEIIISAIPTDSFATSQYSIQTNVSRHQPEQNTDFSEEDHTNETEI